MEKDALKKTAVVVIAVIVIAMFVVLPVCYFVAELPLWVVAVVAIIFIALAAAMAYYAAERLKEIEEGLDDAVDDY